MDWKVQRYLYQIQGDNSRRSRNKKNWEVLHLTFESFLMLLDIIYLIINQMIWCL